MKILSLFLFNSIFLSLNLAQADYGFIDAVESGDTNRVEKFLKNEPRDIDGKFKQRSSGLHVTALFVATVRGDLKMMEFLLKKGANVNERAYDSKPQRTALRAAFDKRSVKGAELLLKHGADPNIADEQGKSLLHYISGYHSQPVSMLEVFLKHGANPNLQDNRGNTPAHDRAEHYEYHHIKILINHGADLNIKNHIDETVKDVIMRDRSFSNNKGVAFNDLSKKHKEKKFKELEDLFNAKREKVEVYRKTEAIFDAIRSSNLEKLNKLIETREDANLVNKEGHSTLYVARYFAKQEVTEFLYQKGALASFEGSGFFDQVNKITKAIHSGSLAELERLVQNKADANLRDQYGFPVLQIAVAFSKDSDIVEFLLNKGANVYGKNFKGIELLEKVVEKNSVETAKTLIRYGLNVNEQTKDGTTIFHRLSNSPFSLEMMKALVSEGKANLNLQDERGNTALHLYLKHKTHDAKLILKSVSAGANPFIKNKKGKTPLDLIKELKNIDEDTKKIMIKNIKETFEDNLNLQDERGNTALHLYVKSKDHDPKLIIKSVSAGADPFIKNKEGETALDLIRELKNIDEDTKNIMIKNIKEAFKANLNLQDERGNTALHLHIKYKAPDALIIRSVSLGADPFIKNKEGKTPLDLIKELKNIDEDTKNIMIKHIKETFEDNLNLKDERGNTALHLYIKSKDHDPKLVIRSVSLGANPFIKNKKGKNALDLIRELKNIDEDTKNIMIKNIKETFFYRLNLPEKRGKLTKRQREKLIKKRGSSNLLPKNRQKMNQNKKDRRADFFETVRSGNIEKLKQHIKNGADINQRDVHGNTALHIASLKSYYSMAEFLIKNGIRINEKNQNGDTAFHFATEKLEMKMIQLFVINGALVNSKNKAGKTALHSFVENLNIHNAKVAMHALKFLLKHGARADLKDHSGKSLIDIIAHHKTLTGDALINLSEAERLVKRNKPRVQKGNSLKAFLVNKIRGK